MRRSMSEDSGKTGERIAKVMARAGVASRREAERMIGEGRVEVNGRVVARAAFNVVPGDSVRVDGRELAKPERMRLWKYHKPAGLLTTTRDDRGRRTIYDELPESLAGALTVGRLDFNSEGLLLLTNDGGLKRRLELPSTGWMRKYRVRIRGRPNEATFEPLRRGIEIDGERFRPMQVTLDRQQGANAWATVAIREGRNREVRRAMEAVDLVVNRLIRVSFGPFRLGDLKSGETSEIRQKVLREQLGLAKEGESAVDDRGPAARPRTVSRRKPKAGGRAAKGAGSGGAGPKAGAKRKGGAKPRGPRRR